MIYKIIIIVYNKDVSYEEGKLMRLQIQSKRFLGTPGDWTEWIDESTDAYAKRNRDIAISAANVVESAGRAFGHPRLVRIVKLRWLRGPKVVWEGY